MLASFRTPAVLCVEKPYLQGFVDGFVPVQSNAEHFREVAGTTAQIITQLACSVHVCLQRARFL